MSPHTLNFSLAWEESRFSLVQRDKCLERKKKIRKKKTYIVETEKNHVAS
jgi:hypothetical protein